MIRHGTEGAGEPDLEPRPAMSESLRAVLILHGGPEWVDDDDDYFWPDPDVRLAPAGPAGADARRDEESTGLEGIGS